ncbi:hypothetical protein Goe20_02250 [Bacillus phage vB_BsuM-Goe20]|nr:hypothetical protein Goe20_02250 [Bacillus phage vB_BsuM-Goe20]
MKNMIVTLETYEERKVEFPREWLEKAIAPETVGEFLDRYIWDDTDELERQYLASLGQ